MCFRFPTRPVLALLLCLSAAPSTLGEEVAFETDIRPILAARCVRCHGPDKQQGQLRLDGREHALRGGESGQPVIGAGLETNELWRRVASATELRMPPEGPPLTEEELARLRAWVAAGALWPGAEVATQPPPELSTFDSTVLWIDRQLSGWYPLFERLRPTLWSGVAALALLVAMAHYARSHKTVAARGWQRGVLRLCRRVTPASYVLVALGMVISGAWIQSQLHEEERQRLAQRNAELAQTVADVHALYRPPGELVRPNHPRGVRQTYYRGNDERSEKLFNGGFYRTATIDLTLVNAAGNAVRSGDTAMGPILLLVEIRRAAKAAPDLFTDAIAKGTTFSTAHAEERRDPNSPAVRLEIVEPGEFWRATLPLGTVSGDGAERLRGRWYVLQGDDVTAATVAGTAHYGIAFDLAFEQGVVQPGSDLWMAPLLYTGGIIVTPPGQIHASEWLDFRPIPEIEGEHTTDPELLGTPPHATTNQADPEDN